MAPCPGWSGVRSRRACCHTHSTTSVISSICCYPELRCRAGRTAGVAPASNRYSKRAVVRPRVGHTKRVLFVMTCPNTRTTQRAQDNKTSRDMTRSQQSMQQRQNLGDTAHNASVCVSLNMSKRRTIINHAQAAFRPVTRGLPDTSGSSWIRGR